MKIAFLYMGDVRHVPSTIFGPIGIAYIASHIEKYGGYTDVHLEVDAEKIIDLKPDIVGIGSYTDTYSLAIESALKIKKKLDIPVILGGPHTTSLPHVTDPIFDAATVGEAEDTFLELLNLFKNGNFNTSGFETIKSLVYHKDGKQLMTPRRADITDLDYIPSPKREMLKYTRNGKTYAWNQHIHSSRGCPYECVFCAAKKISGKVRYHSPEQIIVQIKDILERFNQPQITFSDDLFTLNVNRLERIAELIEKEKLNKYCTFTCCVRANRLTEKVCRIFQRMNMRTVCFGFESGDNDIIKYLKASNMKVEHNTEAIELSRKYDMKVVGNFIIGSPPETENQLANTYWFAFSNRKNIMATYFCHATPFPMISWWDEAIDSGLMEEDKINWKALNVGFDENDSVFMNKVYSKEFFKEAYKYFKELEKKISSANTRPAELSGRQNRNSYYKEIYKNLDKFISPDESILVVSQHSTEYFIKESMKDKPENAEFIIHDKDFSFPEKSYDFIFLDHSTETIRNPEELIKGLNIKGKLLVLVHNSIHISNLVSVIKAEEEVFPHIYYSEKELINITSKLNMKLTNSYSYKFLSNDFITSNITLISLLSAEAEKFPYLKEYDVYSKFLLFEKV